MHYPARTRPRRNTRSCPAFQRIDPLRRPGKGPSRYVLSTAPTVRRGVSFMRRVVVTGLGVVSPNGIGKDAFWSACIEGRSGVGPIKSFDASRHPVHIAAEVPDFDIHRYVPAEHRKCL